MELKMMNGNVAEMSADAIVLPANAYLEMCGSCAEAIFKGAGVSNLKKECDHWIALHGPSSIGDVVVTSAFRLNATYLFHAVVPNWIDGASNEYVDLLMTYVNALRNADLLGCNHIAFPLLATENNGFDLKLAFEVALEAIHSYEPQNSLRTVYLILHSAPSVAMAQHKGFHVTRIQKAPQKPHSVFSDKVDLEEVRKVAEYLWVEIKELNREHPVVLECLTQFALGILAKKAPTLANAIKMAVSAAHR